MAFKITKMIDLDSIDFLVDVEAPEIAERFHPGQFVMLMTRKEGERIPMSVMKAEDGKLSMFIRKLGKTSKELRDGIEAFENVIGPLGHGVEEKVYGNILVLSDAVCGHAENYAICDALGKIEGNTITSVQTFPSKAEIYPDEYLAKNVADRHFITTEDGSFGDAGSYVTTLKRLLKNDVPIDFVFGGGKLPTMKAVSTILAINNIDNLFTTRQMMVDGSGMCGACRLYIDGEMKLACVDGPMFDSRKVNWTRAMKRYGMFKKEEKIANEYYEAHKGGCGQCQK
ncbi:sulfide/dihydroorotate dehydrogenase-like FAD/NAD-binding protein [Sulfurospirillum sp. 1612]|uniref:sulfide/dihydroorotate dehydrogenase-like FAD/NAD-binding protein n=1 Tax=Sulfurospirillum sp. 1612 TaxID=3094835 RepID=UPI002F928680